LELTLMQRILKITNELKVKKNGKNTFSKYDYFKLEDIQDALNPLLEKHNVFMHYVLSKNNLEVASDESFCSTLTLFDTSDATNCVQYVVSLERAEVKGASNIQMSGATLTYGKRQAVMNAFNISEDDDDPNSDAHDPTNPKNLKPVAPPVPTVPVEKSHEERVTGVLNTFKVFKVEQTDFERKFEKPMTEFGDEDFSKISGYYSELKKQKKTKEEVFG